MQFDYSHINSIINKSKSAKYGRLSLVLQNVIDVLGFTGLYSKLKFQHSDMTKESESHLLIY